MKLKDSYVIQEVGEKLIMVGTGQDDFQGMVRLNSSAGTIVKMLQEETDAEQIISKMTEIYNVDYETLKADVERTITTLRNINALEE